MKKSGLLIISLMIFVQAEFNRGDNSLTVIDSETKLEWQDSYENDEVPRKSWNNFITYCENLTLDNQNDWRVPNINELKTIIVDTQYPPAIATGDNKFKYTEIDTYYWSSTSKAENNNYIWVVHFNNGIINWYTKSFNYLVRCVRGRQ